MPLNNKLLAQYLSSLGAGLAKGGPAGAAEALNSVNQQVIASDSYNNLLKNVLGSGGKITMDANKFNMTMPMQGHNGQGQGANSQTTPNSQQGQVQTQQQPQTQQQALQQSQGVSNYPSAMQNSLGSLGGMINNLTPNDLAGLTPQMINAAIGLRQNQQQLGISADNALMDAAYKRAQMQQKVVEEPVFPIPVQGIGNVSTKMWNALPEDEQKYNVYVMGAQMEGKEVLPRSEWSKLSNTEKESIARTPIAADIDRYVQENGRYPSHAELVQMAKDYQKPPAEQRRPLVTWDSAKNDLREAFGTYDSLGRYAVTRGLENQRRLADRVFDQLKTVPNKDPQRASTEAEFAVKKYYDTFNEIVEKGNEIKDDATRRQWIQDKLKQVNAKFKAQLGIDPGMPNKY